MDCKFCKLEEIDLLDDKSTFRCSYCGYSFSVSRAAIMYDKMMQMPLNSWLLASILWFAAMLTGILLGLGFNSGSLNTTIIFLFMYGVLTLIYGFSTSLDFIKAIGLWIKSSFYTKNKFFRVKAANFEEIKKEVQVLRKKKIISEMATGQSIDDSTGTFIDTDIRPGEKRIPKLAPSFLAGFYTVVLAGLFALIFNQIFPPLY
ncbi:MAG: hypothetical protein GOP50_12860 [Candidatus Heimdallarchaeota archaeon]|nr:hypothetical protein [Candidatus Heimdallarchaeota archaeon]